MNKKFAAVLAGLALVGTAVIVNAPAAPAADPMLAEVVSQCASEVSGSLDAWAEGEGGEYVPAPLWEELTERCEAEFVAGNTWEGARTAVLNGYGYAWR